MPRRANGVYYVERDWDAFIAPVTTSNPETTITTTPSNGTIVVSDGDLNITSNGYTIPLYSRSYTSDYNIIYDYSNVTIPTYEVTYNSKSGLQLNFDELYKYGVKPPKRCIRI
jgi:hypothetical protein